MVDETNDESFGVMPSDAAESMNERLAVVAGRLNAAHSELVDLTVELLDTEAWRQGGRRSPEAFLIWKIGVSSRRARQIVTTARRRAAFPVVGEMFDRGEISLDQAHAAFKAPAWADADIAHFVTIATVPKIERALRSGMFEGDPDEAAPEPTAVSDRVSFGAKPNGRWTITGNLSVEDGRLVEAALTERKDALFGDGDETVTWADALVDVGRRSLDQIGSPGRRDQYRTWLHLDVTDGQATTTDGWHIPMAAAQRLLCDGVVQPVWEHDGVPFSVGRAQRIVPARTRRFVERRDRGCRVPGCTADRFVEIHHIIHWLDGGATDTWNLISLCPAHHKLHHRGLLGITGNADEFDGVCFTDESGRLIPGIAPPTLPTGPPPDRVKPYEPPLAGKFDWNWIGLGWIHPKAIEQRRAALEARHTERDAA